MLRTDADYRILQIFLSKSPRMTINEVYVKPGPGPELVCTCPGYRYRARCKHLDFVEKKIAASGGQSYPVRMTPGCPSPKDISDPAEWYQWLVRYCAVEVV